MIVKVKTEHNNEWIELTKDIKESIVEVKGLHSFTSTNIELLLQVKAFLEQIPAKLHKSFSAFLTLYFTSNHIHLPILTSMYFHLYMGKYHSKIDFISEYLIKSNIEEYFFPYINIEKLQQDLFDEAFDSVIYGNFTYVFRRNVLSPLSKYKDSIENNQK